MTLIRAFSFGHQEECPKDNIRSVTNTEENFHFFKSIIQKYKSFKSSEDSVITKPENSNTDFKIMPFDFLKSSIKIFKKSTPEDKLDESIIAIIHAIVNRDASIKLNHIWYRLKKYHDIHLSKSTIARAIKRFHYEIERVNERNESPCMEKYLNIGRFFFSHDVKEWFDDEEKRQAVFWIGYTRFDVTTRISEPDGEFYNKKKRFLGCVALQSDKIYFQRWSEDPTTKEPPSEEEESESDDECRSYETAYEATVRALAKVHQAEIDEENQTAWEQPLSFYTFFKMFFETLKNDGYESVLIVTDAICQRWIVREDELWDLVYQSRSKLKIIPNGTPEFNPVGMWFDTLRAKLDGPDYPSDDFIGHFDSESVFKRMESNFYSDQNEIEGYFDIVEQNMDDWTKKDYKALVTEMVSKRITDYF